MDAPDPLPPVFEATLDAEGVAELLDDVAACGGRISVSVKRGARALVGGDEADGLEAVEVARRCVGDPGVLGVQLRYGFEGARWCDTILRRGKDFRLVRTPQARPNVSAGA